MAIRLNTWLFVWTHGYSFEHMVIRLNTWLFVQCIHFVDPVKMDKQGKTGVRYGGTGDKADLDNHANQCNPNNPEFA